MSPRTRAACATSLNPWVSVELVVPNYVMKRSVVDLIKRRSDGVFSRVAETTIASFQNRIGAGSDDVLLTEPYTVVDRIAAKWAGPLRTARALRKALRVEFVDEKPIDRLTFDQQRSRFTRRSRAKSYETGCSRCYQKMGCSHRPSEVRVFFSISLTEPIAGQFRPARSLSREGFAGGRTPLTNDVLSM